MRGNSKLVEYASTLLVAFQQEMRGGAEEEPAKYKRERRVLDEDFWLC